MIQQSQSITEDNAEELFRQRQLRRMSKSVDPEARLIDRSGGDNRPNETRANGQNGNMSFSSGNRVSLSQMRQKREEN